MYLNWINNNGSPDVVLKVTAIPIKIPKYVQTISITIQSTNSMQDIVFTTKILYYRTSSLRSGKSLITSLFPYPVGRHPSTSIVSRGFTILIIQWFYRTCITPWS